MIEATCPGGPPAWLGVVLLLVLALAPVVVAVLLYRRARARAESAPRVAVTSAGSSPWGGQEITAVLALGLGGFVVPVVGPLVGLVLTWSSRRWTRSEKTVATALVLVPALLLLLPAVGSLPVPGTGVNEIFLLGAFGALGVAALGPVLAAIYLSVVLSRR